MIDWSELENRFDAALLFLDGFRVPSIEDFAQHEAHLLTGGLVHTPFNEKTAYFELFSLPGGQDWVDRSHQLYREIKGECGPRVDDYRLTATEWRKTIALGIAQRAFSFEFFCAWSVLEQLSGRVIELEALNDSAAGRYKREVAAGSKTSMKAHKCWYALWLSDRDAIEDRTKREEAQKELLALCKAVFRAKLQCPRNPDFYGAAWFGRLLQKDGKKLKPDELRLKDVELTGSLDRLSTPDIQALVADSFLVVSVLPPLRRSDFIEVSTAP